MFHPLINTWFQSRFGEPTEPQRRGWPEILAGRNTLIAAPTGSGKTLAAFLACLDRLLHQSLDGTLTDGTQVVYISPLKALSNDIHRNLEVPLAELWGYANAIRSLSRGRAAYSMTPLRFEPVPKAVATARLKEAA